MASDDLQREPNLPMSIHTLTLVRNKLIQGSRYLAGRIGARIGLFLALLISIACSSGSEPPADLSLLWVDSFDTEFDQDITSYDSRWTLIFGNLQLSADRGALFGDPGQNDKRDDYGYRVSPVSGFTITQDWFWDIRDAIGAENVVNTSGSLYELTLYNDRLQILRYDGGGDPAVYATLKQSRKLGLEGGFYRLVFHCYYSNGAWELTGEVQDPVSDFGTLATVSVARESTHGPSIGQGVGVFNVTGGASYMTQMSVAVPSSSP